MSTLARRCVALLAWSVCACAMIHDSGKPAPRIAPEQIGLANDLQLARDGWPRARWWTAYGDPQLDALIEYALAHAPDARVARPRIDQARAGLEAAHAAGLPHVYAGASVDRERVAANSFLGPFAMNEPALGFTGPWYTEGLVGIGGSYTVDLWGEDRARVRAAIGVENARVAEAAAVELELASAVAQLYASFQTVQQKTALLVQARSIQSEVVASHQARVGRGLESRTPVAEAEALRLQVEEQITLSQMQARQLRETIRALIGAHPNDMPPMEPAPLPATRAGVPDELSYRLLARRPDLQAMRWYVQASLDQVEVAKAMFYPTFDIKAFFGLDSIHIEDLFSQRSAVVHLIPGLTLPIFDGGRLNANLKNARASSDTMIEQYNGAVLRAVRDVAVAGTRLQALQDQERLQEERVKQSQTVLQSARAHRDRGLVSQIKSREAELPVLYLQAELAEIRGRRVAEHVALVKALGGGYDSEARAAKPSASEGRHGHETAIPESTRTADR